MTRITQSFIDSLVFISSDSSLINKWIKNSLSRIWVSSHWEYPLTELQEFFDFVHSIGEPLEVEELITQKHQVFLEKVNKLKSIKDSIESKKHMYTFDKPSGFIADLKEYQPDIIAQMLLMHRYLVAIEMGLGKTVVSLFGALKIKQHKPQAKILLVCEAGAINDPWLDNIQEHTTLIKNVHIIDGSMPPDVRKAKIEEGVKDPDKWFWIVSYDTFRTDFHNDKKERIVTPLSEDLANFPLDWDLIIYDEITKAKNIGTLTSQALVNLRSDYIWGLSGTPIINTYYDLYGVMKLVNPQIFTTKNNFTEKYLVLDFFKRPVGIRKSMIPELRKKLFPWYFEATKSDYGLAKPVDMQTIRVPLTKIQQDQLNAINEKIVNQETSLFENATNIRRLCNTAKVFDEWKDLPIEQTTNKFAVLTDLLDFTVKKQGKRILVFSFFKTVIELLREELKDKYKVEIVTGDTKKSCSHTEIKDCATCPLCPKCKSTKRIKCDFDKGDVLVLLGTDALQKAHNFQTCDTIVNFDLPWTSAELKQRIGRIDRINNLHPKLYVYNIVTESTVEDRVIKVIEQKEKDAGHLLVKYSVQISKLSKTIRVKVDKSDEVL